MDLTHQGFMRQAVSPEGPLGQHVISEFFDARNLTDPGPVAEVLRRAAGLAGATVLGVDMRDFGEGAGFTGVALLAESHITLHTWPEFGYAAIDIFMCGSLQPLTALAPLAAYFAPAREDTHVIPRGILPKVGAADAARLSA